MVTQGIGSLKIINVTDPASPSQVGSINTHEGPRDIATVANSSHTFALLVSEVGHSFQIVDISNPASPSSVSRVSHGSEYKLSGATGIATVANSSHTYALVTSHENTFGGTGDTLQIIDITTPAYPSPIGSIRDGSTYAELESARGVATASIGGVLYAIVASHEDDGIQIVGLGPFVERTIYISPAFTGTGPMPASTVAPELDRANLIGAPYPAPGVIADTLPGFDNLNGTVGIAAVTFGPRTYALVAAEYDDSFQIIDITNPASPIEVAAITDNSTLHLNATYGVESVTIGTSTYALVTGYDDDGFQIFNITNPASPVAVVNFSHNTENEGVRDVVIDGPRGITTVTRGTTTYALVVSGTDRDGGLHIVDISNPTFPRYVRSVTESSSSSYALQNATDVATFERGTAAYAIVASFGDNGVQIINITDPGRPEAVIAITENGTYPELGGAHGITTVTQDDRTYALVASRSDNGLTIINVTNPALPAHVADVPDNDTLALDGAFDVTTVVNGSLTYALVSSEQDSGVQIFNITNPASPVAIASVTDGAGGFDDLGGARGIAKATIRGDTYVLVAANADDAVEIIGLHREPAPAPALPSNDHIGFISEPVAAAAVTDGHDTELDGASGATTVTIGSRTYALVASTDDDGVQIMDVTDPRFPAPRIIGHRRGGRICRA